MEYYFPDSAGTRKIINLLTGKLISQKNLQELNPDFSKNFSIKTPIKNPPKPIVTTISPEIISPRTGKKIIVKGKVEPKKKQKEVIIGEPRDYFSYIKECAEMLKYDIENYNIKEVPLSIIETFHARLKEIETETRQDLSEYYIKKDHTNLLTGELVYPNPRDIMSKIYTCAGHIYVNFMSIKFNFLKKIFMLTEQELKYRSWREEPDFPYLDERQKHIAMTFIDRLSNGSLPLPLYRHQYEAVMRVIYNGEKLGRWDSLLDIVTGGGKTVIMAALIAYFKQVRGYSKFLILVPGTIVRERVKDDFEPKNPGFAYSSFPLFFPPFENFPETITTRILRDRSDASSIKDADIIIANIHQLYENKASETLEILLADNITPELVIFNDEAHNAAAMQYREVLKLLRRKTRARIDLTATPYRLDKQDLDTYPPIYEFHIAEAMQQGVVKQIVVTKPDIASVKMQYEEWDDENKVVRVLDEDEMPWEQIEKELKNSGAVKFVTAKNARRQQLQIAQANLDYQKKCVPLDHENNPQWTPLMLVVALSQKDAWQIYETLQSKTFGYKEHELLLVHSKQNEIENKKAFLLGRKGKEGLSSEDTKLWEETRKIKVIIAVSMLREGWDVRNISVICLFRKFSYQKKGNQIHTVYGPQIIGRGLRKIRNNERDLLFVIDHPAFKHNWLWEILSATEYKEAFNPGDTIDESKIEDIPAETNPENTEETDDIYENFEDSENKNFDIEELLNGIPDIPETEIISDWQEYFKNFDFKKKIASAHQNISNVKSNALSSQNTIHETPETDINLEELNQRDHTYIKFDRQNAINTIIADIENEPHRILMSTYKSETAKEISILTDAIWWILGYHFDVKTTSDIYEASDEILHKMLFCLPSIFDEMKDPSIIPSILQENYDSK